MTVTDFADAGEMWPWIRSRSLDEFRFLIETHGFEVTKDETSSTQYSLEYQKGAIQIGLWISLGTRPEVFIKMDNRKLFTDTLIAKHNKGLNVPIHFSVFGERIMKEDYCTILEFYAGLIMACLDMSPTVDK